MSIIYHYMHLMSPINSFITNSKTRGWYLFMARNRNMLAKSGKVWFMAAKTKGFGLHSNLTCNTTELEHRLPYQPGGTGLILSHTMVPRMIGKGADIRGLGRWSWTRLQGKTKAVTVLSAYRPYKLSSSGVQTVYEQHARALPVLSDSRIQFLIDLKQCI